MPDYKNFRFKAADLGAFKKDADAIAAKLDKGSRIMGLTRGDFSLIDLIHSVLKKIGPSEVTVVTWSAGIKDVHNVKWMADTDLITRFTLMTDHSYKTRQAKYAASIEQLFGAESILTSEIHAKFTLIKNKDFSVTIRTSMNLNANKTCESFEIDECDEIYRFYNGFVEHVRKSQKPGFEGRSHVVSASVNSFFAKDDTGFKGENATWFTHE